MAIEHNTFPQFGDPDDASRFAQLIGHDVLTNYVATGLSLTPDFANSELTVSEGVFYVDRDKKTAASDGKEISNLGYAAQLPSSTLSLPTSGFRHVVANANLNTTDNPTISLYEDLSTIPEGSVEIGTVDVDAQTVAEVNREPSASFEMIDASNVSIQNTISSDQIVDVPSDHGMTVSGPFRVDGSLNVDGSVTDTIGPIHGTGTISGTGRIKSSGGTRYIEPLDGLVDNSTFVVRSGWQTSLTTDSFTSYRFPNTATLKIEDDESLTFTV